MSPSRTFSPMRAAAWASTWGMGVGIGVALGAYLTVIGGAGAPGPGALDATELAVVPALSGLAVFAAGFLGRAVIAFLRGLRAHAPHE